MMFIGLAILCAGAHIAISGMALVLIADVFFNRYPEWPWAVATAGVCMLLVGAAMFVGESLWQIAT